MRKVLVIAAMLIAPVALAHDFWIEPSTFRPAVGAMVRANLRVGQEFNGDPVARDSAAIEKFVVRDNAGERYIAGLEGRDPAGFFTVDKAGGAIVGYRTHPKYLELPPDKFEAYLRDEGLERVIAWRTKRGESLKASREIYSRCAKSLLVAGDGPSNFEKPLGLRFEIVPVKIGDGAIDVRLLYESKPLAGALVIALHRDDPALRIRARSDAKGNVSFQLPKRGVWLIKSVWMIPAPAASNADWESLWASLTFKQ